MGRIGFSKVTRSPERPKGKWHLIGYGAYTLCDLWLIGGDWPTVDRKTVDPNDLCAKCLRYTR